MLVELFQKRYLSNLNENYSLFYDDFHEYGNRATAKQAIYFIPGLNGVPGQVRFAMPAIKKIFGKDVYIKCLYLDEFSAKKPIWEKYSLENVEKKAATILADLTNILRDFDDVIIFASSSGFYDFANAYGKGVDAFKDRLKLFWVACAPPQFKAVRWQSLFYKVNGFEHQGYAWVAFPNMDFLRFIHSETSTKFKWKTQQGSKSLFKVDLESRFRCGNSLWFYASIDCFNACLAHAVRDQDFPLDVETYILAANNDGYWDRAPQDVMSAILHRYVKSPKILFKKTSHLWVAIPNNIVDLLQMAVDSVTEF